MRRLYRFRRRDDGMRIECVYRLQRSVAIMTVMPAIETPMIHSLPISIKRYCVITRPRCRTRNLRSSGVRDIRCCATNRMDFVHQFGRCRYATAATGAAAGAHRQFGHGPAARSGGLANLVVGDAVAEADVHGDGGRRVGTVLISPRMRMVVNCFLFSVTESFCRFRPSPAPARCHCVSPAVSAAVAVGAVASDRFRASAPE